MPISKTWAQTFISDITQRPDDFFEDDFCLIDRKTGREWWVCSGGGWFDRYLPPRRSDYTMIDTLFWPLTWRGKCWRRYKAWKSALADKSICKEAVS